MKSYLCNYNYIELFYLDVWNKCVHKSEFDFLEMAEQLYAFTENCRLAHMISEKECDQLIFRLGKYEDLWIAETSDPQGLRTMDYPIP